MYLTRHGCGSARIRGGLHGQVARSASFTRSILIRLSHLVENPRLLACFSNDLVLFAVWLSRQCRVNIRTCTTRGFCTASKASIAFVVKPLLFWDESLLFISVIPIQSNQQLWLKLLHIATITHQNKSFSRRLLSFINRLSQHTNTCSQKIQKHQSLYFHHVSYLF